MTHREQIENLVRAHFDWRVCKLNHWGTRKSLLEVDIGAPACKTITKRMNTRKGPVVSSITVKVTVPENWLENVYGRGLANVLNGHLCLDVEELDRRYAFTLFKCTIASKTHGYNLKPGTHYVAKEGDIWGEGHTIAFALDNAMAKLKKVMGIV